MGRTRSLLEIPGLRVSPGRPARLSFRLFGRELFFESDAELLPRAESVCSAILLQAMAHGYDIVATQPVCPVWRRNLEEIQSIVGDWWGYHPIRVVAPESPVKPMTDGVGLFFSAGVDSFFSLHQEHERITHLVYVEGYDVDLREQARLDAIRSAHAEIARETGKELIHVRTNLRRHRFARSLHWSRVYGASLVAIGHLLAQHGREFLFASGAPRWREFPRGNHEKLDPLWSSDAVRYVHHGGDHDRLDKIEAIKTNLVARRHLRVCWQERGDGLNCGRCEKCLRTQLMLMVAGALDDFRTFQPRDLASAVAELEEPLTFGERYYWEDLRSRIDDSNIRTAIAELLSREPQRGLNRLSGLRSKISRRFGWRV
jgi:hypothetical protein